VLLIGFILTVITLAVVLLIAGLILAAVVAGLSVLLGFGASLGLIVANASPQQSESLPKTSRGISIARWFGVVALGISAAALTLAIAIGAFIASLDPAGASPMPARVLLLISPAVAGALAGMFHVLLLRRPRRHIAGWGLAFGLPGYGVVALVFLSSAWLHDKL
jgi:hypothetical protein